MASIIPGYNYDIFISYRQKDNKGDRWVSEFVDALKDELESTFKEEISVYFDINPHDGLLETHSVDQSLEDKLKCLILIPIISRTYCDPKCFAWQNEFCVFNKLAKEDKFGRDIKLAGGNVASRILPVKIHDLDPEDQALLENELGGALRGVELIYKSSGVNRPLRANEDHPQDNLNKTYYRDQINKVANAVKELITALKNYGQVPEQLSKEIVRPTLENKNTNKVKIVAGAILVMALIILGFIFIPKLFNSQEEQDKSIAVLPFINDSQDEENTYFINGIMEEVILNLQSIRSLRVPGRTSTEKYRNHSRTIPEIAKELGVNYIVEASGQKYGDSFVLRVQLIEGANDRHLWGESFEQEIKSTDDIVGIQIQIAESIATELNAVITPEEKMVIKTPPTSDLTAYDFFLRGKDYYNRSFSKEDQSFAIQMYKKAIEIDPEFSLAWVGLATCSRNLFNFNYDRSEDNLSMMRKYLDSALFLSPGLKEVKVEEAAFYYQCKQEYVKSLQLFESLKTEYPNDDEMYFWIGLIRRRIGDFRKSFDNLNQAIELNPTPWKYWWNAATTLIALRDYPKAENYFIRAIELNPSNEQLYSNLFSLYILNGQLKEGSEFLLTNKKHMNPETVKLLHAKLEILYRDYDNAIQFTQSWRGGITGANNYEVKEKLLGLIYRLVPDNVLAIKYFKIAKDSLLNKPSQSENDYRFYSSLGIINAGLGLKAEALEAGRKALNILDFSVDSLGGYWPEMDMVKILVIVGEYNEAMIRLDKIIKHNGYISVESLKLDPFWDPVRDSKKFNEIISNPNYQIILSDN